MSQLNDTMLKSLNKQVQREFMSAYIYYGLVAYVSCGSRIDMPFYFILVWR